MTSRALAPAADHPQGRPAGVECAERILEGPPGARAVPPLDGRGRQLASRLDEGAECVREAVAVPVAVTGARNRKPRKLAGLQGSLSGGV